MDKGSEKYKEFRRKANLRNKKYYNKPEVKERKRIYKKEHDRINKKKISEYGYRLRARPKTQERLKKWREENKERLKLYGIIWRKKNKPRKKLNDKNYYYKIRRNPKNIEREKERKRKFRKENPNVIKEYRRKYYASPKGKLNSNKHNHRRLALKHKCKFDLTDKQIKKIYDRDKVCVYCSSSKNLELDHIIPLAKGGEGIFYNFVLACRRCNGSKNDKDVFVWCDLEKKQVPEIIIECLNKQKEFI